MNEGKTFFGGLKSTSEDFVSVKVVSEDSGKTLGHYVMPRFKMETLLDKTTVLTVDTIIPKAALDAALGSGKKTARLIGNNWVSLE